MGKFIKSHGIVLVPPVVALAFSVALLAGVAAPASVGPKAGVIASSVVASTGSRHLTRKSAVVITAQTLDAARSFSVTQSPKDGAWDLMLVYIKVTDTDNSVTALDMTCTASTDNNTSNYQQQGCDEAAGVKTCYTASFSHNPTATTSPKLWYWEVDIPGVEDFSCTFTNTGGLVADTLDVSISYTTKG